MASKSTTRRIAAEFLREQLQMDGIQTSALSQIFKEEPPPLETFLYDSAYLNHLRPTLPVPDESGYAFKLSPIQMDFLRNFEQIFHPELYIAMVEEFGPQWAPLPMKNMFSLEWAKGCKSPDELVYNARTGQWTKLRDFKAGPVAAAYAEDGKVIKAQATDSFLEGEGHMFEVTTHSGRKTKVWHGHRFLAWGQENYPSGEKVVSFSRAKGAEWKRLRDLKAGDHIAVSTHLPEPEEILELPDWQVEWMGMMIGDGCMTPATKGGYNHSLCIGYQSPVQLQYCKDLVQSHTNLKCRVADDGRKNTLHPTHGRGSRGKEHALRNLMRDFGLQGHGAATKHIPKELFSLSNRQIALLVSRLIDTDGWISTMNTVEVGYGTISEQLADDMVHLFLRLGAVADKKVMETTYNGEPYISYQVRVRKQGSLQRLLPQLTLLDKEPKRLEALEWLSARTRGNTRLMHGDMEWDRIKSIEYVGFGEFWTMTVDGPSSYISAGGILDHNSGKDTCVRIGFTRIASLLGHMNSPQAYFNMASTDSIHALNVAATAPQARKAFFDPMKKLFKSNKHLSEFFYGDDPAEGSNQIRLKNDIYIISGNSIAENQEGLNLIAGVADEISAFKVAEEFQNKGDGRQAKGAEGIVNFLRSSATSRFPKTYKVAQISFPRFRGDAIQKAMAQGRESIKKYGNDKSQWYVSGPYATWEVKPGISKEDFREHYDEDPEMAATMYECKPPKATNLFIRDETSIDMAFSEVRPQPITVEYYWGLPPGKYKQELPDGLEAKEGWQVEFHYDPDFGPKDGAIYGLHGDMAIKGDRAGIGMSHVRTWRNEGDDEKPVIKNDFTFSFESDLSDPEHPREVQIRWYRQLIWELIDMGFEIGTVTFDQFQSFDMMQTLNSYGIDSGLLSLDRNDKVYQNLKDLILDGRLEGYRPSETVEPLVMQEIKRLRKSGRKVDHPPGFSKDEADGLAGSVFNALALGGEEEGEGEWNSTETAMYGSLSEVDMVMYPTGGSHNPYGMFGGRDTPPNPFQSSGYFRG